MGIILYIVTRNRHKPYYLYKNNVAENKLYTSIRGYRKKVELCPMKGWEEGD